MAEEIESTVVPNLDFKIRFATKDKEATVFINSDGLLVLAEELSKFFSSKGIENRLEINDLNKDYVATPI